MKLKELTIRAMKVLLSCTTEAQLRSANKYCELAHKSIKSIGDKKEFSRAIFSKLLELQIKFNLI